MKLNLTIFFVILFLTLSCRKNECAKFYWGWAKAKKNSSNWTANIRAHNYNLVQSKISIIIEKFSSPCIISESLLFQNIPSTLGRYRLFKIDFNYRDPYKTVAYFGTILGGDAGCDWYDIIETDSVNNYIQVDNFDAGSGKVNGIFSAKLAIKLPKCDSSAPDTLLFSNGVFNTKILN